MSFNLKKFPMSFNLKKFQYHLTFTIYIFNIVAIDCGIADVYADVAQMHSFGQYFGFQPLFIIFFLKINYFCSKLTVAYTYIFIYITDIINNEKGKG